MPEDPQPADTAAAASEARRKFLRSQTFLAKMPDPGVFRLRLYTIVGLLALFFLVIPILNHNGLVEDYKLSALGKYLCFAFVALGVDLIWGYTGLLSLCQALFFCLGGYAMAMHLSLPQGGGDVRPEYNNIPQFMFFNNVRELPGFWHPFESFPVTILLGLFLPGLVAGLFGFFILRSRVRGVYFSIITQAVAWGAWLLISRNEMLLGGTNGLTNFYKPLTQSRNCIVALYLLTLTALVVAYLICRAIVRSRLGRVLVAVRDKETRLYFAGYKPYAFKVFAFSVGAMLAAVGGMLYSPQFTIISPQDMDVPASITMVVLVALGGRGRLWGAIFGSLLYKYLYASLTSDLPAMWPYVQGTVYIGVILYFPDGFVGLWDKVEKRIRERAGSLAVGIGLAPIAITALFVLGEALGVTPRVLNDVRLDGVPLKYVVVVVLLGTIAILELTGSIQHKGIAGRGFAVSPAAAEAAEEGVTVGGPTEAPVPAGRAES